MITVEHRCGYITEHESVGDLVVDLKAMYPGAQIDGARALVWADDEGMPVATIYYRGTP